MHYASNSPSPSGSISISSEEREKTSAKKTFREFVSTDSALDHRLDNLEEKLSNAYIELRLLREELPPYNADQCAAAQAIEDHLLTTLDHIQSPDVLPEDKMTRAAEALEGLQALLDAYEPALVQAGVAATLRCVLLNSTIAISLDRGLDVMDVASTAINIGMPEINFLKEFVAD
ncbi:uncharacterized protein PHACADRAFT_193092 [Phanerochaete carnosa HHB-10118-sp]|uniref:Uncharacterized protein n=1 Tax=Phanerochaete carnosa (strain HHB-10118-sp) TaxID=650164 RepID=K5X542_PHACS|nr:uncharacterized protein PHACADRAFT_193092 [Phanerochaete carnosa HHB-10118-sp]EKM57962.1 hypothetical protein PHACADRAFT_193092 [Phanerochaete carnosa HHB-10118-sp]